MYSVSMKDSERYFLRVLLLHVAGATSFDNLLTVEEKLYPTFHEAAKARGLTTDENVWDTTLVDAACAAMPRQLRELFAYICIFGGSSDLSNLWIKHKENLIEDFARTHNHPCNDECETCESYALRDISDTLLTHAKMCSDFGLRNPPTDLQLSLNDFFDIATEREIAEDLSSTLNPQHCPECHAIRKSRIKMLLP